MTAVKMTFVRFWEGAQKFGGVALGPRGYVPISRRGATWSDLFMPCREDHNLLVGTRCLGS